MMPHFKNAIVYTRRISRVILDVCDLPRRCILTVDGEVMYDGDNLFEAQRLHEHWFSLLTGELQEEVLS